MAITLSQLQDYVDANIKQNGRNAITGNVMNYALKNTLDLLNGKQDALVSGTNIKTINGVSILGSGNVTISGGGAVAGSDKQIQFNDGGAFGGNSNLLFNKTNGFVGIGLSGSTPGARLDIKAYGSGSTDMIQRWIASSGTVVGQVSGDNKFYLLGDTDNGTLRIEKGSGHIVKFIHRSSNTLPSHLLFGTEAAGGSTGQFVFDATTGSGSYPVFTMQRLIFGLSDITGPSLYSDFATNAACFVMKNASGYAGIGVDPTGTATDHFAMYSKDISTGNAAPHFRTENGSIIKLYKQDLPTTPTTAEVATLLSNLGLANLI